VGLPALWALLGGRRSSSPKGVSRPAPEEESTDA
jgi:hypothetical protein